MCFKVKLFNIKNIAKAGLLSLLLVTGCSSGSSGGGGNEHAPAPEQTAQSINQYIDIPT